MSYFRISVFALSFCLVASSALAGGGGGCWETRDRLVHLLKHTGGHECTYARYKYFEHEGQDYFETKQHCEKGEQRLEIASLYEDPVGSECGIEMLTVIEPSPNDCKNGRAMRIVYETFRKVEGGYCETRDTRTICDQPYYTGKSATYFIFDQRKGSSQSCDYRLRVKHANIENREKLWQLK